MTEIKKTSPYEVTCPACNAKPMESCTQPDDNGRHPVKRVHFARELAAEEAEVA